jgi:hypothetical protein
MKASKEPIPNPQREGKAIIDRIRMTTPHIVWLCGFWYSITAPSITIRPKTTPTMPTSAPNPPKTNEKPTVARTPPRRRKIPPINDRTNAAVGLSANYDLIQARLYNI